MAERLREVADLPMPVHVVLLGEQTEVVAQAEEPLEQRTSLRDPAVDRKGTDQPKRAGQELPLVAGQPVVGVGSRVAGDEAVPAELTRDRVDGARDPLVGPRQEADEWNVQDARVELL